MSSNKYLVTRFNSFISNKTANFVYFQVRIIISEPIRVISLKIYDNLDSQEICIQLAHCKPFENVIEGN